jgi:DNA-binding transcriptional ArsR family regulator/anti-sigma regulatory factor (Ser/Thr protein kinase)
MDTRKRILAYLARRRSVTGADLRSHLGISRQALSVHVRSLVEAGKVARSGSTRGARYMLRDRAPPAATVSRELRMRGLDEARVWDELAAGLNLRRALRPNVEAAAHYAFTEMLNNAIEHSGAGGCSIRFRLEPGTLAFDIRDPGIGVFHSIASKLRLDGEPAALVELLKGRTTTMREAHTGEGIFFTSRVADRFVLRSHGIQVEWSRLKDDVFVSNPRFLKGTAVSFEIQRTSRLVLETVFGEFAPEEYDFQFQKTRVLVKLLRRDFVSRSEAKRLVANLEKFSEIALDFRDVKAIGQGFADEVFRVFAGRHPAIRITTENAAPAVDAMIRHVASLSGVE